MPVPQPSSGKNLIYSKSFRRRNVLTDNGSLVPISRVFLLDIPHPGDHDMTGGEHDAPHVPHHLPPRQPHLPTLTLFHEEMLRFYSIVE